MTANRNEANYAAWLDRRNFLGHLGTGLGSIALAALLEKPLRRRQVPRRSPGPSVCCRSSVPAR